MRIGNKYPQGLVQGDCWEKIHETYLEPADPDTKLLIHAEGSDTSTTFYDASPSNHTITANGTAQIDTAQYKFGSSALLLDGDSDYLSIPDSTDWDIFGSNSDNWTIDFWVKHTDHTGTEYYMSQRQVSNQWYIAHTHGSGLGAALMISGVWELNLPAGGEITDTNWHHVAFIKVADEYGLYLDGTQVSYLQNSSTHTLSAELQIGARAGANFFDGHMDEIRIIHSNAFSGAPNSTPDDTITIPTIAYAGDDPVTSITISNLDGNTDEEYKLICGFVNGYNGVTGYQCRPNNDSGSNYGYQYMRALSTTLQAARSTSQAYIILGDGASLGDVSLCEMDLYAKSGYVRTAIVKSLFNTSGTTVSQIRQIGYSWNDTSNNITSLVIYATQTNGFMGGTYIALYKKVDKV